jgi:hypothetical protein
MKLSFPDNRHTWVMNSASKRPWYPLHWVTWVVAVLVAGGVVVSEYEEHLGVSACGSGAYSSSSYFGWPQAHVEVVERGSIVGLGMQVPRSFDYTWRWAYLGFNVLICVVIVVSTTWVLESRLRSPNRLQFQLRSLLAFTGVVAVLLWLLLNSEWLFHSKGVGLKWTNSPLVSWDDVKRPVRWPVLLGITCTIHSLGWLAFSLLHRAYTFVRR